MPVAYHPRYFWAVAFAGRGGAALEPQVWQRALALLPPSIILASLEHFGFLDDMGGMEWLAQDISLPFSILIGLMLSFRLADAFDKWERAEDLILELHQDSRTIVSQLCAYLPPDDQSACERVLRMRRLLVLGCCFIKSHVRGEKSDLQFELSHGLLTKEEQARMKQVTTVASGPLGDGKKDKYPTKNRTAWAFQEALWINHELLKDGSYLYPHTWASVDEAIRKMSNTYEACEHIGTTLLPLQYAQLTRFIIVVFLMGVVPIAVVQRLTWASIPLCFLANFVYILTDECASQMELPFGEDKNDVDIEKMIRRIDKHTASQCFGFISEPVMNFNLYSDSRSTSQSGDVIQERLKKNQDFHSLKKLELDKRSYSTNMTSCRDLSRDLSTIIKTRRNSSQRYASAGSYGGRSSRKLSCDPALAAIQLEYSSSTSKARSSMLSSVASVDSRVGSSGDVLNPEALHEAEEAASADGTPPATPPDPTIVSSGDESSFGRPAQPPLGLARGSSRADLILTRTLERSQADIRVITGSSRNSSSRDSSFQARTSQDNDVSLEQVAEVSLEQVMRSASSVTESELEVAMAEAEVAHAVRRSKGDSSRDE